MIVGSYNIRGLCGRFIKSKVCKFVIKNHLDFLDIQETKLVIIDDNLCYFSWGNSSCEWSFSLALGNSGGILSIWCKAKGKSLFSFLGVGFLGVCLTEVFLLGVVSWLIFTMCSLVEKRNMWDQLIILKDSFGGDI